MDLPATDRSRLDQARQLLLSASRIEDLQTPRQIASELISLHPDSREVRFLAAEVAYRGSQWAEAIRHFQHVEPPRPEETLLLFYYAVSLFESGEQDKAIPALRSVLPLIEQTPFVDSYVQRILGSEEVAE